MQDPGEGPSSSAYPDFAATESNPNIVEASMEDFGEDPSSSAYPTVNAADSNPPFVFNQTIAPSGYVTPPNKSTTPPASEHGQESDTTEEEEPFEDVNLIRMIRGETDPKKFVPPVFGKDVSYPFLTPVRTNVPFPEGWTEAQKAAAKSPNSPYYTMAQPSRQFPLGWNLAQIAAANSPTSPFYIPPDTPITSTTAKPPVGATSNLPGLLSSGPFAQSEPGSSSQAPFAFVNPAILSQGISQSQNPAPTISNPTHRPISAESKIFDFSKIATPKASSLNVPQSAEKRTMEYFQNVLDKRHEERVEKSLDRNADRDEEESEQIWARPEDRPAALKPVSRLAKYSNADRAKMAENAARRHVGGPRPEDAPDCAFCLTSKRELRAEIEPRIRMEESAKLREEMEPAMRTHLEGIIEMERAQRIAILVSEVEDLKAQNEKLWCEKDQLEMDATRRDQEDHDRTASAMEKELEIRSDIDKIVQQLRDSETIDEKLHNMADLLSTQRAIANPNLKDEDIQKRAEQLLRNEVPMLEESYKFKLDQNVAKMNEEFEAKVEAKVAEMLNAMQTDSKSKDETMENQHQADLAEKAAEFEQQLAWKQHEFFNELAQKQQEFSNQLAQQQQDFSNQLAQKQQELDNLHAESQNRELDAMTDVPLLPSHEKMDAEFDGDMMDMKDHLEGQAEKEVRERLEPQIRAELEEHLRAEYDAQVQAQVEALLAQKSAESLAAANALFGKPTRDKLAKEKAQMQASFDAKTAEIRGQYDAQLAEQNKRINEEKLEVVQRYDAEKIELQQRLEAEKTRMQQEYDAKLDREILSVRKDYEEKSRAVEAPGSPRSTNSFTEVQERAQSPQPPKSPKSSKPSKSVVTDKEKSLAIQSRVAKPYVAPIDPLALDPVLSGFANLALTESSEPVAGPSKPIDTDSSKLVDTSSSDPEVTDLSKSVVTPESPIPAEPQTPSNPTDVQTSSESIDPLHAYKAKLDAEHEQKEAELNQKYEDKLSTLQKDYDEACSKSAKNAQDLRDKELSHSMHQFEQEHAKNVAELQQQYDAAIVNERAIIRTDLEEQFKSDWEVHDAQLRKSLEARYEKNLAEKLAQLQQRHDAEIKQQRTKAEESIRGEMKKLAEQKSSQKTGKTVGQDAKKANLTDGGQGAGTTSKTDGQDAELVKVTKQLTELQSKHKLLQAELEQERKALSALTEDHDDSVRKEKAATNFWEKSKGQIKTLETSLEKHKELAQKDRAQKWSKDQQISELQTKVDNLRRERQQAHEAARNADERVANMRDALRGSEASVKSLKEANEDLLQKNNQLSLELRAKEPEIDHETLELVIGEKAGAETDLHQFTAEKDTLESRDEVQRQELRQCHLQLASIKKELDDANSRAVVLDRDLQEARSKPDYSNELERLEREKAALEKADRGAGLWISKWLLWRLLIFFMGSGFLCLFVFLLCFFGLSAEREAQHWLGGVDLPRAALWSSVDFGVGKGGMF